VSDLVLGLVLGWASALVLVVGLVLVLVLEKDSE
jgi:hypothetical protein